MSLFALPVTADELEDLQFGISLSPTLARRLRKRH